MKTREQNRNNKLTEIERLDWFVERIQKRVAFGSLSERSGEKTSCPKNFVEINLHFALTSYCNTIGKWNNAFSILRFSLVGKRRVYVLIFHLLPDKTNNEHLQKSFFKVIRKSLHCVYHKDYFGSSRRWRVMRVLLYFCRLCCQCQLKPVHSDSRRTYERGWEQKRSVAKKLPDFQR